MSQQGFSLGLLALAILIICGGTAYRAHINRPRTMTLSQFCTEKPTGSGPITIYTDSNEVTFPCDPLSTAHPVKLVVLPGRSK